MSVDYLAIARASEVASWQEKTVSSLARESWPKKSGYKAELCILLTLSASQSLYIESILRMSSPLL